MTASIYRFEFDQAVPVTEAEMSLHLAMITVESFWGQARVLLDAAYHLDEPQRAILVDGSTAVGAAVVQVFTHLLLREFGDEAFEVRRLRAGESDSACCGGQHAKSGAAEVAR